MNKRLAKKRAKKSAQKQLINLLIASANEVQLPSTKKINYAELDFEKILKHSVYTDPITNKRSRLSDVLKGVQNYTNVIPNINTTNVQTRPTDLKPKSSTLNYTNIEPIKYKRSTTEKEDFDIEVAKGELESLKQEYINILSNVTEPVYQEYLKEYLNAYFTNWTKERGLKTKITYFTNHLSDFKNAVDNFNANMTDENYRELAKLLTLNSKLVRDISLPTIDDYVKMEITIEDEDEDLSRAEKEGLIPPYNNTTHYDSYANKVYNDFDEYTSLFLQMLGQIPDEKYIQMVFNGKKRMIFKDLTGIKDSMRSAWYDLVINEDDETLKYIQTHWDEIVSDIESITYYDSDGASVETDYTEVMDILTKGNFSNIDDRIMLTEMSEVLNGTDE